jgi:HEAT repeat protein
MAAMVWRCFSSAALAAALLLAPAAASATPPSKAEVRQLLSGYEQTPGAATWRTLGPEALSVLIALYDDPSEAPYVRLRAVHAAGFYPTPATRTFLLAVARAPGQSDLFVRQAVLGLARAFGVRAVRDILPFLEHTEPVVREGAAAGLGRIGSDDAREALRARLVVERSDSVRLTIERSLSREVR